MSDNIQYWINRDGIQEGPLTLEQLRLKTIGENAFVWSAGFDDWKPLRDVPELARLVSAPATVPTADEAKEEPVVIPAVPEGGEVHAGQPLVEPEQPRPEYAATVPAGQYPPCPPTNLVWAIISTILCCIPLGVVAIYYSNKVSKKYYEGDLAAAEHYSEVSAWWCIGTIVGGIILSPFVSLIQLAMMS